MSASRIREAAAIYRQLPQQERDRLRQRGMEALTAFRVGFRGFGARKPRVGRERGLFEEQADIPGLDVVAVFDLYEDIGFGLVLLYCRLCRLILIEDSGL